MLGNYCDDETKVILDGLSMLVPSEQREAAKYARERKEAFIGGRAMIPDYWQRALRAFDPTLAMRFDIDHGRFVIDRWIADMSYWHPIWLLEHGFTLAENHIPYILAVLAQSDLQRRQRTADEYLREKHEARAEKQQSNAKARTEAMLEAVDSLSSKRTAEFIETHRAIHRGETIVCHGEDEKIMDRMAEASKNNPAPPPGYDKAINPGMNPLAYQRTQRRDVDGTPIVE